MYYTTMDPNVDIVDILYIDCFQIHILKFYIHCSSTSIMFILNTLCRLCFINVIFLHCCMAATFAIRTPFVEYTIPVVY